MVRGQHGQPPEPWAKAFDDWLAEALKNGDEAALANYRTEAPHARDAFAPVAGTTDCKSLNQ